MSTAFDKVMIKLTYFYIILNMNNKISKLFSYRICKIKISFSFL